MLANPLLPSCSASLTEDTKTYLRNHRRQSQFNVFWILLTILKKNISFPCALIHTYNWNYCLGYKCIGLGHLGYLKIIFSPPWFTPHLVQALQIAQTLLIAIPKDGHLICYKKLLTFFLSQPLTLNIIQEICLFWKLMDFITLATKWSV